MASIEAESKCCSDEPMIRRMSAWIVSERNKTEVVVGRCCWPKVEVGSQCDGMGEIAEGRCRLAERGKFDLAGRRRHDPSLALST